MYSQVSSCPIRKISQMSQQLYRKHTIIVVDRETWKASTCQSEAETLGAYSMYIPLVEYYHAYYTAKMECRFPTTLLTALICSRLQGNKDAHHSQQPDSPSTRIPIIHRPALIRDHRASDESVKLPSKPREKARN